MFQKGDLVKLNFPQHESSYWKKWNGLEQGDLGVVVEIEKDFYQHNDYFQDRLTIYWTHGEKTQEPDGYVEKVNVVQDN